MAGFLYLAEAGPCEWVSPFHLSRGAIDKPLFNFLRKSQHRHPSLESERQALKLEAQIPNPLFRRLTNRKQFITRRRG
jgi:hypothetical protein